MKRPTTIQHRVKMPRKAILLAAGFGTRMEPLSWDLPKPMMPLFGVPLLEHALLSLLEWGVQDVLVNLHHAPQEILRWFRERPRGGPRVVFSFEPDILGTGGALRRAAFFVGQEACWLVNTDIAFMLDPRPLVRQFQRHRPPAVLWLDPVRGPRTVACNAAGVIENFAVPEPGIPGTYTYCGIQVFHPGLLDALPAQAFCSVIDACRNLMRGGQAVYGCVSPGSYWADLGTPERYLQAHTDAPATLCARGKPYAARKPRCRDSVLWQGARIVPGGSLVGCIAGRGVQVSVPVQDACIVRADVPGLDPIVRDVLRALRMKPASSLYMQLPRRGSDREFVRLADRCRSAILIRYRADRRPENARYAGHARFLGDCGVPVPRVRFENPAHGVVVFEDLGSASLQDLPATLRDGWYRRVMPAVARLHAIALSSSPPREPDFDMALYAWEHTLFLDQFMARYFPHAAGVRTAIAAELGAVATALDGLPSVLLHRDLQSSNILLHRDRAVLIDFQGMRAGPAVYDLASLLYDPYVDLSPSQRLQYLDWYLRGMDPAYAHMIRAMLPLAGIQRLVQALGAFGRLGANPETARFTVHIPAARRTLADLMVQTGRCQTLLHGLQAHPVCGVR